MQDAWLTAKGIHFYRQVLRDSQHWDPERLEDFQAQRLHTLLISAYENTEYYRTAFWDADFDPYKDFESVEDLKRAPILDKDIARERASELVNPHVAPSALELRTSGTSGDVFRAFVSPSHWVVEQATVWRHWSWLGYRFRDRMAVVRSYVPREGEPFWRLDRLRNFMFFSAYHLSPEIAMSYLEKMRSWGTDVLRGYPSSLFLLAQVALDRGFTLPGLKGVLTASETLLPHYRDAIERAFDTQVFDWYGQGECTATLSECEAHQGMHVNMEYGACELVADPMLPANERRIVATCLANDAMPLIRYDTGDIAVLHDGEASARQCDCGKTLPIVRGIRGRADDFLLTAEGIRIPSVNLYTLMYSTEGVRAFQLVQDEIGRVEVRIETQGFSDLTRRRLHADLADRLGPTTRIELLENQGFVQSADGKKAAIITKGRSRG